MSLRDEQRHFSQLFFTDTQKIKIEKWRYVNINDWYKSVEEFEKQETIIYSFLKLQNWTKVEKVKREKNVMLYFI